MCVLGVRGGVAGAATKYLTNMNCIVYKLFIFLLCFFFILAFLWGQVGIQAISKKELGFKVASERHRGEHKTVLLISLCISNLCQFKERKNLTLKTCAPDFSALLLTKLYAKIKGAHTILHT